MSKSKRSWKLFLLDMLECINKALLYVQGLELVQFVTDDKTQDAVVRNLEILGEAAKRIPEEVKRDHPEIPWAQIVGMRNRLVHGYFAIDPRVVWEIVSNELPKLRDDLQKLWEQYGKP